MARWGKRAFSITDMIGDMVMHWWATRHLNTWADFARRMVKFACIVLVALVLVHVLYPTQREGWTLWLGQEKAELAHWTAVALVGFTAIMLPLTRFAYDHGAKWLARASGVFTIVLIITVLMGTWNFYAFASGKAVQVAESSRTGAEGRIAETQAALTALNGRAAAEAETYRSELARTPANHTTARSRIIRASTEAAQANNAERARLQSELRDARAADVDVAMTVSDPRPIDRFMAGCWDDDPCENRTAVALALDLQRSAVFEFIALIAVALGVTASTSRIGAPVVAHVEDDPGRLKVEDKRAEPAVRVDQDAIRRDYADAVQSEIEAEFTDATRSQRAKKGWMTRLQRREAERRAAEEPVLMPNDARVARAEGAAWAATAAVAAGAATDDREAAPAPADAQDEAVPEALDDDMAAAIAAAAGGEEPAPAAEAAGEVELPDGEGVMVPADDALMAAE